MEKTDIEWCDSTVNPTENCDGCELWNTKIDIHKCYAGKMTERWKGKGAFDLPILLKPGRMEKTLKWSDMTGTDRPEKPWLNGMPRMIFVGDMADVFSKDVQFEYLYEQVIDVTRRSPHIYLVLTKQAQRMKEFVRWCLNLNDRKGWPSNIWLGVSVTNQPTISRLLELDEAARDIRRQMPKESIPKFFVSYEPILYYVDFKGKPSPDWMIMGGESGTNQASFLEEETVRKTLTFCRENGIAPFVKQMGTMWAALNHSHSYKGGDMSDWPQDIRVREMPRIVDQ